MSFKPEDAHELLQIVEWSYSLSAQRKVYMRNEVNA